MAQPTKYDDLVNLARELQRCERSSLKACAARAALLPGSTRARVTTANARWGTAAEARERALAELREEVGRLSLVQRISPAQESG